MEAHADITAFKRIIYANTFYRSGRCPHRPECYLTIKLYDIFFGNEFMLSRSLSVLAYAVTEREQRTVL